MVDKAKPTPAKPPKGVPEERIRRLYIGPLESFTAERKALAGELKGKAAAWVKKLPKPTRAAWLANQLSERKPKRVKELLDAAAGLRRKGTLSSAEKLRAAARRQQDALDSLVATAEALGREHKASGQILNRVADTLQAASIDEEVGEALGKGTLTREQQRSSIGFGGATAAPASLEKESQTAAQRRRSKAAEQRRTELERKLKLAQRELAREQRLVAGAREKLAEGEKRLKRAEGNLRSAERDLAKHRSAS